jgi:hypothetical protein
MGRIGINGRAYLTFPNFNKRKIKKLLSIDVTRERERTTADAAMNIAKGLIAELSIRGTI